MLGAEGRAAECQEGRGVSAGGLGAAVVPVPQATSTGRGERIGQKKGAL